MLGVLVGFAIIAAVILVGYIVGRSGVLGERGGFVLGRLAFYVLAPCLLFTTLADADVHALFSSLLFVSLIAAVVSAGVFVVVARALWKRPVSETVVGALGSGYVNANNIGIPVAVYVLGDAATSAPVILLQLLLFAPIALTILDVQARGHASIRRILLGPVTNPIILGSLLGVLLSIFQVRLPDAVMEPFHLIGAAAVPVVLISFGMSLHGTRPLAPGSSRREVILASTLKLTLMPLVAWLVGSFVFGLSGHRLFAVVVLAALPAAQNVFNYAQRYDRGVILARDVVLITTALSLPVLLVIAALLAPPG
ncbi:MAG: AEC family transporter [Actinobacteria bacterium]|nr:AEC family transporter [Actinomycetota bacterium]